jgi:hypothetical protein
MNITIVVLSVAGQPRFSLPKDTKPAVVRKHVANRFGFVAIGVPHSWIGREGTDA